jgi:hypothetical protein
VNAKVSNYIFTKTECSSESDKWKKIRKDFEKTHYMPGYLEYDKNNNRYILRLNEEEDLTVMKVKEISINSAWCSWITSYEYYKERCKEKMERYYGRKTKEFIVAYIGDPELNKGQRYFDPEKIMAKSKHEAIYIFTKKDPRSASYFGVKAFNSGEYPEKINY